MADRRKPAEDLDAVLVQPESFAVQRVEDGGEHAAPAAAPAAEQPAVRALALVFLAMFQAYATLQNLQLYLKKEMGVGQQGEAASLFTDAVTMVHVGKLVSRLAHNVVLACMSPLARSYLAMAFVLVGTCIPPIFIVGLRLPLFASADGSKWIGWVFLSYFLNGVGIGIFEATFLAVITPLGRRTKSFAILGIPLGFFVIGVPGFLLLGVGLPPEAVYWWVVACVLAAIVVTHRHAPKVEARGGFAPGEHFSNPSLVASFLAWRTWLPMLVPHLVGKAFVNFGMENLFPVILFTFNAEKVPLLGPTRNEILLDKNFFQAVQNAFIFLGDSLSRRVPYFLPTQRYCSSVLIIVAAMICEVVAFLLTKTAVAWVAWLSIFLAFWGNGLVYAIGSKHIDQRVPSEHHLMAYSSWCFVGDISSVVGAKSQDLVRSWICGGAQFLYECKAK